MLWHVKLASHHKSESTDDPERLWQTRSLSRPTVNVGPRPRVTCGSGAGCPIAGRVSWLVTPLLVSALTLCCRALEAVRCRQEQVPRGTGQETRSTRRDSSHDLPTGVDREIATTRSTDL